jgi:hypothetical protein
LVKLGAIVGNLIRTREKREHAQGGIIHGQIVLVIVVKVHVRWMVMKVVWYWQRLGTTLYTKPDSDVERVGVCFFPENYLAPSAIQ